MSANDEPAGAVIVNIFPFVESIKTSADEFDGLYATAPPPPLYSGTVTTPDVIYLSALKLVVAWTEPADIILPTTVVILLFTLKDDLKVTLPLVCNLFSIPH